MIDFLQTLSSKHASQTKTETKTGTKTERKTKTRRNARVGEQWIADVEGVTHPRESRSALRPAESATRFKEGTHKVLRKCE